MALLYINIAWYYYDMDGIMWRPHGVLTAAFSWNQIHEYMHVLQLAPTTGRGVQANVVASTDYHSKQR